MKEEFPMLFTNFVVLLRSYSRPIFCLVTACGVRACARARRWQPGEECEGNWKFFLMSIVDSNVPDVSTIVILDIYNKMWPL